MRLGGVLQSDYYRGAGNSSADRPAAARTSPIRLAPSPGEGLDSWLEAVRTLQGHAASRSQRPGGPPPGGQQQRCGR